MCSKDSGAQPATSCAESIGELYRVWRHGHFNLFSPVLCGCEDTQVELRLMREEHQMEKRERVGSRSALDDGKHVACILAVTSMICFVEAALPMRVPFAGACRCIFRCILCWGARGCVCVDGSS